VEACCSKTKRVGDGEEGGVRLSTQPETQNSESRGEQEMSRRWMKGAHATRLRAHVVQDKARGVSHTIVCRLLSREWWSAITNTCQQKRYTLGPPVMPKRPTRRLAPSPLPLICRVHTHPTPPPSVLSILQYIPARPCSLTCSVYTSRLIRVLPGAGAAYGALVAPSMDLVTRVPTAAKRRGEVCRTAGWCVDVW
jgi:hypothetical protein